MNHRVLRSAALFSSQCEMKPWLSQTILTQFLSSGHSKGNFYLEGIVGTVRILKYPVLVYFFLIKVYILVQGQEVAAAAALDLVL